MSSAAAANVTQDDVQLYLSQPLDDFNDSCRKGFSEHKYDPVTAGLTIGSYILNDLVNKCTAATQP